MDNKLEVGYNEIADTLADVLEVADQIAVAVKDGLQTTDLLVLWTSFPKLQEIYQDRKKAFAELLNLSSEEAYSAIEIVAERLAMPKSKLIETMVPALKLIARTYRFIDYTIHEGKDIAMDWAAFYKSLKGTMAKS